MGKGDLNWITILTPQTRATMQPRGTPTSGTEENT